MRNLTGKKDALNGEAQAAKEAIVSFLIALKNYGLYPQSHAICKKSIAIVHSRLQDFLNSYHSLRLDVEKDRLLFKSQVVHQDAEGGDSLAFLLFRDGIQWLEFETGLDPQEIQEFLKIMHKYKSSQDGAEGDFVTALWEAGFPNIHYKAADIYWDSEPLFDLSSLNVGKAEHGSVDEYEEKQENSLNIAPENVETSLWKLTPEEAEKLREMILEDERRDTAQDLLDMVLVLLNDQRNEKDLMEVLEFLEGEFQDTLAQGDFGFAYKFLVKLHRVIKTYASQRPWALPVLYRFFKRISSSQVLGALSRVLLTLDALDSDRISLLRQFLVLLPSEATLALGPMLSQLRSPSVQRQLMQVIAIMAKRDPSPLEQLLDSPEEFMVQKLVCVLGYLKDEKSTQLLLRMTHHSSEKVRKQAVIELFARGQHFIKHLFPLIEDPSQSVRRLILDQLGREKNRSVEALLLDYLEQARFKITDHQHLMACYRALGRCGSSDSIPFLRSLLFNRKWILDFGRSVHRKGAVVALVSLGTEEAMELLHKASRSLFPSVRIAYRKALEVN